MEHQSNRDGFWKALSAVLVIVLIGIVAYTVWQAQQPRHIYYERVTSAPQSDLVALADPLAVDHGSIYWVADLAEQALPFVVNVETIIEYDQDEEDKIKDLHEEWQENMPDLFRQFEWDGESLPETPERSAGEGSGFIIREDGYIVTNSHVVANADKFMVHMYDGTAYEAELIGVDNFKDIAVLKIQADEELPVAILGDSSKTRVGEPVVAIGSPLGYQASVTAGIVSTNYRSRDDLGRASDVRRPQAYIQTDAAINRGNSGGPLLNADGEVIGVNQAIVRWEGDAVGMGFGMGVPVPVEGIGFAIPIDEIKPTIEQLVQHGKVVYPGISAQIASLEDYLRTEPNLELSVEQGVYVSSVVIDGPADRAGIEAGDVILSINDVDVDTSNDLIQEIQQYKVGERVKLRVARQGGDRQENVSVVLGELDITQIAVE